MKLGPESATQYLRDNELRCPEEFALELTAEEFDQLHFAVKELRGRTKWIEPFTPDEGLNALLREIARAGLQISFRETFPSVHPIEWQVLLLPASPGPAAPKLSSIRLPAMRRRSSPSLNRASSDTY